MLPTSEVMAKVSPISPILNSLESRGLCCRSCFGPRTCVRGITNSSKRQGSESGFPLLTPTMQAGQDSDGGGWIRGNVYAVSSDCVVVLALGDLVAWRHFVRASRGQLSFQSGKRGSRISLNLVLFGPMHIT